MTIEEEAPAGVDTFVWARVIEAHGRSPSRGSATEAGVRGRGVCVGG